MLPVKKFAKYSKFNINPQLYQKAETRRWAGVRRLFWITCVAMFPYIWLFVLLAKLTSWISDLRDTFWKIFSGSKTLQKLPVKSWYSIQIQKNVEQVSKQRIIKKTPRKISQYKSLQKLRPEACNFIKKETPAQVLSYESREIFKNTFFIEHLRWLLLSLIIKLQHGGIGNFWDFCTFGLIFLFIC